MKGRREESEVIIRLDQQDGLAHICVCSWPAMFRKMVKLYGESKDGPNPEYSARWSVPMKIVSLRRLSSIGKAPRVPFPGVKRRAGGRFEKNYPRTANTLVPPLQSAEKGQITPSQT